VLGEHEASLWALDRAAQLQARRSAIATIAACARGAGPLEEAERAYDEALASTIA
jgi:hypothetical protein